MFHDELVKLHECVLEVIWSRKCPINQGSIWCCYWVKWDVTLVELSARVVSWHHCNCLILNPLVSLGWCGCVLLWRSVIQNASNIFLYKWGIRQRAFCIVSAMEMVRLLQQSISDNIQVVEFYTETNFRMYIEFSRRLVPSHE